MRKMFMKAEDVMEVLDVSKSYAYKLIRRLNEEQKAMGCIVIEGRVDTKYFYDQFYGTKDSERRE